MGRQSNQIHQSGFANEVPAITEQWSSGGHSGCQYSCVLSYTDKRREACPAVISQILHCASSRDLVLIWVIFYDNSACEYNSSEFPDSCKALVSQPQELLEFQNFQLMSEEKAVLWRRIMASDFVVWLTWGSPGIRRDLKITYFNSISQVRKQSGDKGML